MNFPLRIFSVNPQETAVTFTQEILNGNHFCAVLLRRTNIYYESHVTQFSYNLVLQPPFLETRLVNNNVTGVFKDAIDEIITSH